MGNDHEEETMTTLAKIGVLGTLAALSALGIGLALSADADADGTGGGGPSHTAAMMDPSDMSAMSMTGGGMHAVAPPGGMPVGMTTSAVSMSEMHEGMPVGMRAMHEAMSPSAREACEAMVADMQQMEETHGDEARSHMSMGAGNHATHH